MEKLSTNVLPCLRCRKSSKYCGLINDNGEPIAHLQKFKDVGVFVNCIKASASCLLILRFASAKEHCVCVLFKLILQYP